MGGIDGFATNSLFFYSDRTSEPYKGFNKGRYWSMRNRDVETITESIKEIEDISPVIWGSRSDKNMVYGQLTGTYNVKGVSAGYFNIESQILHNGRLLNDIDIMEKRKVCVIGKQIRETLFNDQDPCGKYLRVNGIYYQVVGVVEQRANNVNIEGRAAESAFIPYTTMQQTTNRGDRIDFLGIVLKKGADVQKALEDITNILKTQNEISPTDPQAVGVENLAVMFGTFDNLFIGIDILVWLVGMGTLLAGVIGISNIMMVTVKERMKEIGVRRALGAKPFAILTQIMSESLTLTAIAGLIGLTIGVFILDVVNRLLANQPPSDGSFFENPEVSIRTAVAATIVLLVSGLIAGLIPAWRALQIKAIDAIREE